MYEKSRKTYLSKKVECVLSFVFEKNSWISSTYLKFRCIEDYFKVHAAIP